MSRVPLGTAHSTRIEETKMNKPTYTIAECCGTCLWFERTEQDIGLCFRDDTVDEPTTEIMVCEAYQQGRLK